MCPTQQAAKLLKGFDRKHRNLFAGRIGFSDLFLPKIHSMEVKRKSKGMYWLLFFISTAALIFAIWAHWPWLTLIIPFVTTSFVLAMDII